LAVHGDADAGRGERAGRTGELAAMVGVEYLRLAEPRQRIFQRRYAESNPSERSGRRPLTVTDLTLLSDLILGNLVEPTTRGEPMAPLPWTAKSLRHLVAANRKTRERTNQVAAVRVGLQDTGEAVKMPGRTPRFK
jgi:hypothetical protein